LNRVRLVALLGFALVCPDPARAQAFGQFTGAEPLAVNGRLFGAYLESSNNVLGLMSQLRLSFYPGVDFGFRGGLARLDFKGGDRTALRLGTDLKIAVVKPTESYPYSIAVGGALGVETGDDYNILSLGPTAVCSRSFSMGNGGGITPYVSVGLDFSNIDVPPTNETDLSVPVRGGAEFWVSPEIRFMAELQLQLSDSFRDDFGFSAGVNLPF